MSKEKTINEAEGNAVLPFVSGSAYREHCDFKDAPCNYTGKGWYDRCAWCKDNNGFKRKTDDSSKPF